MPPGQRARRMPKSNVRGLRSCHSASSAQSVGAVLFPCQVSRLSTRGRIKARKEWGRGKGERAGRREGGGSSVAARCGRPRQKCFPFLRHHARGTRTDAVGRPSLHGAEERATATAATLLSCWPGEQSDCYAPFPPSSFLHPFLSFIRLLTPFDFCSPVLSSTPTLHSTDTPN